MKKLAIAALAAYLLCSVAKAQTITINGQPSTPNTFTGATCVGCTMSDPVFTGAPTINGVAAAKTTDIPSICAVVPAADTNGGSVGSSTPCIPRSDSARPAKGLWTTATTDTSCNFTWTFSTPFVATPWIGNPIANDNGAPIIWQVTAVSNTSVSYKAYRFQPLPSSLALLTSLQSYLTYGGACSSITANFSAREKLN